MVDAFLTSKPATYLRWLNFAAMLLHWTYGILGAILYDNGSLTIRLVQDVPTYYSNASHVLNSTQCDIQEGDFTISYTSDCNVGYWDGLLALTVCEFITGFFHALYLAELCLEKFYDGPYFKFWISESHLLRWIEYTFTATTLSVAAVFGSGTRSLPVFVALWIALPATQLCGYVIEKVVHERKRAGFDRVIEWLVFTIGALTQVSAFAVVGINLYFGDSGNVLVGSDLKSESFDGWIVQGILYFISYSFFPIIAALWMTGEIKKFWFTEIVYIYGSFSAKTSLFWLIVSTLQDYLETFDAVPAVNINWTAVRWSLGVAIPLSIDLIFPLLTRYVFLKKEYEQTEYEPVISSTSVSVLSSKDVLRKRAPNSKELDF